MRYAKYKEYGPQGATILVGEILTHEFDVHNNIANIRLVDGTIKRWSLWSWIPISKEEFDAATVLES
jgi:hypothetical protein